MHTIKNKKLIITFEGNEGSGKTTAIKKISAWLTEHGYSNIVIREPGGNKIAEEIRNVIVNKENTNMDAMTELLLYLAARRQNIVETIIPLQKEYDIILIDRFYDSTYAYQVSARGVSKDLCDIVHNHILEDIKINFTFYFDINPLVGQERINNNNRERNRMDNQSIEFYNKVNEGYQKRIEEHPERIITIDAERTEEEVYFSCLRAMKKILGLT